MGGGGVAYLAVGEGAGPGQLPDLAVGFREDVQAAAAVGAEAQVDTLVTGEIAHGDRLPGGPVEEHQLFERREFAAAVHVAGVRGQDPAVHEVAEDVLSAQCRRVLAAVDGASGNGAAHIGPAVPVGSRVVVVGGDRVGVAVLGVVGGEGKDAGARVGGLLVEYEGALALAPAEVVTDLDLVHRLDGVLAYVAEIHTVAAARVPAEAVRVPHAYGVDLAERTGLTDERVGRGDAVPAVGTVTARRVDPQKFAVRERQVLRLAVADALPPSPTAR